MPKTCVVYARISLDRSGEGAGVERQEAECRELAARLGMEVERVYVEDAISATSGKTRPEFEALLEARPPTILVWHLDRLIRTSKELERVLDLKANVHAVTSGHLDLSNPAGRAVAKTVTAWAQYEGEQKSERQKALHRQRKAAGKSWWAVRPFGYDNHGHLVKDEARAVRDVYRRFARGETNLAVHAKRLNAAGFATTGKARGWSSGTVRGFLLAERNLGGPSWAALIDEPTWMTCRDALNARNRSSAVAGIGLLSGKDGVARCGVCDGHMITASRTFDAARIYKCHDAGHVSWPRDAVDEIVSAEVAAVLQEHRVAIESAAREDVGAEDISAALNRLTADYAAERMTLAELGAAIDREKRHNARRATRTTVLKDWDDLTHLQRRAALSVLVEAIRLPSRGAGVGRVDPDVVLSSISWR